MKKKHGNIVELLVELGPMNIFTTLDARAAYWTVEVDPSDRPKTTFSDGVNFSNLFTSIWLFHSHYHVSKDH